MNIFQKIGYYLEFPFVRYAIIVSILVAFCAGLLGVTLVLKRFSYIGDGLSHVAFGIMSVAAVMNLSNNLMLTLPVTMLCAIILLCGGKKLKINGDAAIAMVSVSSLALGYLLMNIFNTSSNISGDVCSSLFGSTSILTLTITDVWISIILSIIVIFIYIFFYNKIFAVTFDEEFSKATGIKTELYNFILAVVISVVIVLAMRLVGSLLISALIIFPALSSMKIFKSYFGVTISSIVISIICAVSGIFISIISSTPVGSTIVVVNLGIFIILSIFGKIFKYAK